MDTKNRRFWTGWLIGFGVLMVVGVIGAAVLPEDKAAPGGYVTSKAETVAVVTEPRDYGSEIMAWEMAKHFAKERLKAPSTSGWPVHFEQHVRHIGEGVYVIEAYVDAENSFGAKIRNNFRCKVEYAGHDQWLLEDLRFE